MTTQIAFRRLLYIPFLRKVISKEDYEELVKEEVKK